MKLRTKHSDAWLSFSHHHTTWHNVCSLMRPLSADTLPPQRRRSKETCGKFQYCDAFSCWCLHLDVSVLWIVGSQPCVMSQRHFYIPVLIQVGLFYTLWSSHSFKFSAGMWNVQFKQEAKIKYFAGGCKQRAVFSRFIVVFRRVNVKSVLTHKDCKRDLWHRCQSCYMCCILRDTLSRCVSTQACDASQAFTFISKGFNPSASKPASN